MDYVLQSLAFEHVDGYFKCYIAKRKGNEKDYFLTIYNLKCLPDDVSDVCERIRFICRNWSMFRCCEVIFDHGIISLESVRPSNIGFMIRQFIVVEPMPIRTLEQVNLEGLIEPTMLANGMCSVSSILREMHNKGFGYGALCPSTITVNEDTFSLRPPPLFPHLQTSFALPVQSITSGYTFRSRDLIGADLFEFGELLCDFVLFGGRSLFGSYSQKEFQAKVMKVRDEFTIPDLVDEFFRMKRDLFIDEDIEKQIRSFISNRRSLMRSPVKKSAPVETPPPNIVIQLPVEERKVEITEFPTNKIQAGENYEFRAPEEFHPVDPITMLRKVVVSISFGKIPGRFKKQLLSIECSIGRLEFAFERSVAEISEKTKRFELLLNVLNYSSLMSNGLDVDMTVYKDRHKEKAVTKLQKVMTVKDGSAYNAFALAYKNRSIPMTIEIQCVT